MKIVISESCTIRIPMIRFHLFLTMLGLLWTTSALLIPVAAQQEEKPNIDEKPQPTFLDIALDPDATAAQKRTVTAMMESIKETDPAVAFEKLKATNVLALYGGGAGADGLSDLTPISQLTNLETLVLFNHNISNLTPISSLVNLRTLRLEVNRIEDIAPLANLRKLESLQIDENLISDLTPLSGLTELKTLWISKNKIADISPLKGLKHLRALYLSGNKVTDLKILADLTLSDLRLSGNGIIDISALRELNRVGGSFLSLDLSDNAIRDVGPLGKIPELHSLNLANNQVEDASALANTKLTWLDLQGNRLSRSPELSMSKLSHINLRQNPIEDFTDLVAYKKANPRVEIFASPEFTRAFENSIPLKKELEGSPILGTWRSARIESEWGALILELRFLPNGMVYQKMLSAEPDVPDLDPKQQEGWMTDGQFSFLDDHLEMTLSGRISKSQFKFENDVLIMGSKDEELRYTKAKE